MRTLLVVPVVLAGVVLTGCGGMEQPTVLYERSTSALIAAGGVGGRDRCAARNPNETVQAAIDRDVASLRAQQGASDRRKGFRIPVHVHIVTTADGAQGDVSGLVPAQIDVLNAAYARTGAAFRLASLEVVGNDAWFFSAAESPEEVEMKAALRRGGPESLNIYTTLGDIYLGWATFPKYYKSDPLYDGVVLYYATLPGTGFEFPWDTAEEPDGLIAYDRGDTATHEVGHWLGLYHTFEGGCSRPGDRIEDTPAEAEPQFFCAPRDSCPGKRFPGMDPIHNFMDYVDDDCMNTFTRDQEGRMRDQWETYRGDDHGEQLAER